MFHVILNMFKTPGLTLCCVLSCLVTLGCSSATSEDYVPDENAGKRALEIALTAWQKGQPMETIASPDAPAVQPQDTEWKNGRKLANFSIGEERPISDGPKQIAVRLTFQNDPKPVDTVYFVVGKDPLWVFRDRDYQRATGM
jgi:hypothetical protein